MIGVPGLAKTLLISTLARVLDLSFGRIQFTPDLMPSDITGTEVLEEDQATGRKGFRFVKGPYLTILFSPDEINRTPPKTQAALLQAMQEREVTVAGQTNPLSEPFFVLATQNPIEQEGTYPLPEAQLDRFMLNLWIDYPSEAREVRIAELTAQRSASTSSGCSTPSGSSPFSISSARASSSNGRSSSTPWPWRATRGLAHGDEGYINELVHWGAGPRASQTWSWRPRPGPLSTVTLTSRSKMCMRWRARSAPPHRAELPRPRPRGSMPWTSWTASWPSDRRRAAFQCSGILNSPKGILSLLATGSRNWGEITQAP